MLNNWPITFYTPPNLLVLVCHPFFHCKIKCSVLDYDDDITTLTLHECIQELFGGYDGVKLLIDYLKRDIDKFGSGLGHHRLLLAAVDCVWCTVVGNAVVEDMFLEQEGVLILLDVLNVST